MPCLNADQQKLVEQYLPCATKLASRFWLGSGKRFDFDEVSAEAKLALCKAAAVYDPARAKFITLLYTTVPQHLENTFFPKAIKRRGRCVPIPVSMGAAMEFPCKHDGPESEAERHNDAKNAAATLAGLKRRISHRHWDVLKAREMDEMTLEQVAASCGITRERVRQVQIAAMRKAREAIA